MFKTISLCLRYWVYLCIDLVYFTTWVQDRGNTSVTRTTQVRYGRHNCARVKNFDFDNNTSENIFSYTYINHIANEILQGEEKFHSKNYLLEMPYSYAKMRLKSAPQKLNLIMAKAILKCYTLDCCCKYPCTFPHSYA